MSPRGGVLKRQQNNGNLVLQEIFESQANVTIPAERLLEEMVISRLHLMAIDFELPKNMFQKSNSTLSSSFLMGQNFHLGNVMCESHTVSTGCSLHVF